VGRCDRIVRLGHHIFIPVNLLIKWSWPKNTILNDLYVLEPYNHYQNRRLCRVPEALGKALKTLGKGFVECRTRQRGLDIHCIGKAFFAKYFSRALGKEVC
jgi:hypothetical protein